MIKLYSPKDIRYIKEVFGFKFSKNLGQNFLTDKNIIDKIIDGTEITEEDLVIEIGPGIGVLTREAAAKAKKVIAIEIDKNLMPVLDYTLGDLDNVEIINQDILKTDLNKIISESGCEKVRIIGNLPYYITTPIIMHILETGAKVESVTVMMQREVADRIAADPGNKTYGAITVSVNYYSKPVKVTNVSRECFMPKPKVDSEVLRLDIRKERPVDLIDEKLFFKCIKKGFGKRRKTLLNALDGIDGLSKEEVKKALETAEIDAKRRAETLSIDEFAAIANCIAEIKQGKCD